MGVGPILAPRPGLPESEESARKPDYILSRAGSIVRHDCDGFTGLWFDGFTGLCIRLFPPNDGGSAGTKILFLGTRTSGGQLKRARGILKRFFGHSAKDPI